MRPHPAFRFIRSAWLYLALAGVALALLGTLAALWAYENDPRVRFRVQTYWGELRGVFVEEPVFAPTAAVAASMPTFAPSPTLPPSATPPPSTTPNPATPNPETTATTPPTATPAPATATLPPSQAMLEGFRHEYQLFNNCGPASLATLLSYWGWPYDQRVAAQVLKPNQDDRNVSPREIYEYALTQGYDAYIRVNGTVEILKRFIAAGYPVMVEKGLDCAAGENCSGWFGHYSVFTGYDDARQVFVMQDTFRGPNTIMTYDEVVENWRPFNYLYLVLFPAGPEHDARVQALLGTDADVERNYREALARAQQEAQASTGQAAAFAWFNVGTNLYYLQDYAGAAAAYDQARQIGLPYRMLWYQFGPYASYYTVGRYGDVTALATFAIDSVTTVPGLEEAYYWRGMAELALGNADQAAEDFRTALERHPGYKQPVEALAQMGLNP